MLRALCACVAALLLVHASPHAVHAAVLGVPVRLQVDLLERVLPYDRGFSTRTGAELRMLVVVKPGDIDSERIGSEVLGELRSRAQLAQHRLRASSVRFAGAAELAAQCKSEGATVVYLSTGLSAEVSQIAGAMSGSALLTVAALSEDVPRGAVLGFGVSSGKPKLLIHLRQARAQHIDFRADLLRIAQVLSP